MSQNDFTQIVERIVLPILSGADIEGSRKSTKRESIAALDRGSNRMLIKPTESAEYRYILRRAQKFTSDDVRLVKEVIEQVVQVYTADIIEEFKSKLEQAAIEKAICTYLDIKSDTLQQLLNQFTLWSTRTYEGRSVALGCLVDTSDTRNLTSPTVVNIFKEDFSAVLSDGIETCLVFNLNGRLKSYISLTSAASESDDYYYPSKFYGIAKHSVNGNIGISLLHGGDILLFVRGNLEFAKRRGAWRKFNHVSTVQRMAAGSGYFDEEIRRQIYLTALDISFAKTGGCISYVIKTRRDLAEAHIDSSDIISESATTKGKVIKRAIKSRFQSIGRNLRKEIVGVDGATVVAHNGELIAVGAIVQIKAGSSGGGRLAATKTLSQYGVAVKISSDGEIKAYASKPNKIDDTPLFVTG